MAGELQQESEGCWKSEDTTYPSHEQPKRDSKVIPIVNAERRFCGIPQTSGSVSFGDAVDEDDDDDENRRNYAEDGRIAQ